MRARIWQFGFRRFADKEANEILQKIGNETYNASNLYMVQIAWGILVSEFVWWISSSWTSKIAMKQNSTISEMQLLRKMKMETTEVNRLV